MAQKKEVSGSLGQAVAHVVDRYRWSLGNLLFAMLALFAVMLFFEDLPARWHNLVAALICYVLLLALVFGFEIRLIAFSDTKRQLAGEKPNGLPTWGLVASWVLQASGLIGLVVYAACHGLL